MTTLTRVAVRFTAELGIGVGLSIFSLFASSPIPPVATAVAGTICIAKGLTTVVDYYLQKSLKAGVDELLSIGFDAPESMPWDVEPRLPRESSQARALAIAAEEIEREEWEFAQEMLIDDSPVDATPEEIVPAAAETVQGLTHMFLALGPPGQAAGDQPHNTAGPHGGVDLGPGG
ncbi:hypothetical protein [Streptomyces longwoodensis]|uniref:hypothetical protein n=1 Tax=Streptomyces longwoodensis TaxID=68231 RepID=UPI00131DB471|nr:hypothetical protein [Streptomyces longwoodensis]